MSAIFRQFLQPAAARRASVASSRTFALRQQRATFAASSIVRAGKEDKLHHEGRAAEIEQEKQESLRKAKDGKGEWHEELGSSSESIIKAERGEHKVNHDTIKELQEETKHVKTK